MLPTPVPTGVPQKSTSPNSCPIQMCNKLLEDREFVGVRSFVDFNKLVGSDWLELDQAGAICDVMIAAEKLLPNGHMDYYGMLRVKRFGQVLSSDFEILMKLLDPRYNHFPCSGEAAQYVSQAWSFLSNPEKKAEYDLTISNVEAAENVVNIESVGNEGGDGGNGSHGGGGGFGGECTGKDKTTGGFYGGNSGCGSNSGFDNDGGMVFRQVTEHDKGGHGGYFGEGKGKEKVDEEICPMCDTVYVCGTPEDKRCSKCNENVKEGKLPEIEVLTTAFTVKHVSSSHGIDDMVINISDDDGDGDGDGTGDYDDEDEDIVTISRTAKVSQVQGKKVKTIPLNKKNKKFGPTAEEEVGSPSV